jgi:Opioid growth factor receptor (OGFr) conserved region
MLEAMRQLMEPENAGVIVQFYLGANVHPSGYLIQDIWTWDQPKLNKVKDYIPWLFPADDRMQERGGAPLLTYSDIKGFQNNSDLRKRLVRSFSVLLNFHGFELEESIGGVVVHQSKDYQKRVADWVSKIRHHNRRISQILRSLSLLGCKEHAKAFLEELRKVYATNSEGIGYDILKHWRYAATDLNKPEH